ncbi:hypothetical protein KR018_009596, partial [Drosophila ironensis]
QFWHSWSRDYLHSLQEDDNLAEGTLVLIHEDNAPPQKWVTGRVVRTIVGDDGKVRVVDIRTAAGETRRPIHKLARL